VSLPKFAALRGPTPYLFMGGIMALFTVPFLTWFNYGPNLMFPSQVSLIYLYERGFEFIPTLYIIGVAA
jgi:hypothetical protein